MIYLADGERMVVVASHGGQAKHPAWYHNLRARPDAAEVEIQGRRTLVCARQATPPEAADLWPRLLGMWPAWETYMSRTDRRFPVMILEPRGHGEQTAECEHAESAASRPGPTTT
jgi:deazaflavin-dependent oxidoreductase (nitroreductase family)